MNKNEQSVWDIIKLINILILGVPKKRERKGTKNVSRNNGLKVLKSEEIHEYVHPRRSINPKEDKLKG